MIINKNESNRRNCFLKINGLFKIRFYGFIKLKFHVSLFFSTITRNFHDKNPANICLLKLFYHVCFIKHKLLSEQI